MGVDEDEVLPATSFTHDPQADSLGRLGVIIVLEEFSDTSTKPQISNKDAKKIVRVQDAVDYLKSQALGTMLEAREYLDIQ